MSIYMRLATLERDNQCKTWQSFRNKRSLLIGDSIIRDIDEKKLVRTSVKVIPDGKVSDISQELVDSLEKDEPLGRIFLCVGAHDCTDLELNIADVTAKYESLVEEIKKTGIQPSDVVISSIPPRKDDEKRQKLVEALNSNLKAVSARVGATYADNDLSFKLANGDINDGYLLPSDGLHLSQQGTNKLAKNLQLPVKKNNSSDITKPKQKGKSKTKTLQKSTTPNVIDSASKDKEEVEQSGQIGNRPHQRNTQHRRRYSTVDGVHLRDMHEKHHHASHASYESPRYDNRRCLYCAEYNHSTRQCGFRGPAICRQCCSEGHKQKFCSEFNSSW